MVVLCDGGPGNCRQHLRTKTLQAVILHGNVCIHFLKEMCSAPELAMD